MIRNSLLNRKSWDKTAVIDEKKYYSYRDLAQKSIAIQRRLPQKQRENIGIFYRIAETILPLFLA